MPRDLTDPALYERLSDAELKDVIRHGKGQMPGFGKFVGDEDLDLLVRYLHTLPKK